MTDDRFDFVQDPGARAVIQTLTDEVALLWVAVKMLAPPDVWDSLKDIRGAHQALGDSSTPVELAAKGET